MAVLTVVVVGLCGSLWEGQCAGTMTVSELKQLLEAETNIPALEQRLLYDSEILDPTGVLQELQPFPNVYQVTLVRRTADEVQWLARFQRKEVASLRDAPDFMRNDFEIVMAAVWNSGENLRYAGELVVAHRGFLRFATECFQSGRASLYHSPEAAQNRRDVVLAAVRERGGREFQHASEELRNDPDVTLAAVQLCPAVLRFAGEVPRGSSVVVMCAVGHMGYGSLLREASNELKGDQDVVLWALQQGAHAFQHASGELRADREFVLRALQQDPGAFEFASEELKGDREFVMRVVQHWGWLLKYASDQVKADRDVMTLAIQEDATAVQHASEELRGDRELMMHVVQQKGWLLKYASDQVKADRDVVRLAVQQDSTALRHASEELRGDPDFVTLVAQQNAHVL